MAGSDPLMMGGACERAREWASLRLDDELSVLEEEILERHLDFCDACRRFEEGMRLSTARIYSAQKRISVTAPRLCRPTTARPGSAIRRR